MPETRHSHPWSSITPGLACLLLLACDAAPPREARAPAPASELETTSSRPTGSRLSSLGPGADTRIYYQFIDDANRVRFVERLSDVPEQWRDRVGFLELDAPPPLTPVAAREMRDSRHARTTAGRRSRLLAAAATPAPPQVILYYADWCGYCRKAKSHLDRRGIAYELRDVDIPANQAELVAKSGGRSIPVIDVDGRILKGYSPERLDQLLADAS